MTIRTTLSFTDRHHRFLTEKVDQGVFASASSAVAAAIEQMIEDEAAREAGLLAIAEEVRARVGTPAADFADADDAFAEVRAAIGAAARRA